MPKKKDIIGYGGEHTCSPPGQHVRRFNAPTVDDVAIVIVGDEFNSRDIVLRRRNMQLQRVSETHRCYDGLQYPLLFCRGEDGYHFNIKMINPSTGAETSKKVSAMNLYSYRLMVRENDVTHILHCRRLFHQFFVDMYTKIETERLNFIRFNQKKLRSEEYIHLRDAINNDGNANNLGKIIILPSSYTGSPRHMHEYAQDAMTYVRHYGRPDLFITFTCNPQWNDIKDNLFPSQSPTDQQVCSPPYQPYSKASTDFLFAIVHSSQIIIQQRFSNFAPTCNISKTSGTAKLLKRCCMIIWDECTMANKKSVEVF